MGRNRDTIVTCDSQQSHRNVPVHTRVRRLSIWKSEGRGIRADRDFLEVGADEYGSELCGFVE
jgi:hypothetical protein